MHVVVASPPGARVLLLATLLMGCGGSAVSRTAAHGGGGRGSFAGSGGAGGAAGHGQGDATGGTPGSDAGAGSGGGSGDAGSPRTTADAASPDGRSAVVDALVGGSDSGPPAVDAGAGLVPIFNGINFDGWIQVPAGSWSVVDGAMHSLGTARGFIYSRATYGDFRMVFTSRLVADPAAHLPCVLFWGNSPAVDALAGIQIQPPRGYMWDYRRTGPTANMSPDRFETRLGGPALSDTLWSQCEMLANRAAGTMRFACCQLNGAARCKGVEIVDFKDPTAGVVAPLAFQVHNARMIEEFKDIYVESPVADPTRLVTPQWP